MRRPAVMGARADDPRHLVRRPSPGGPAGRRVSMPAAGSRHRGSGGRFPVVMLDASPRRPDAREPRRTIRVTWSRGRRPRFPRRRPAPGGDARCVAPMLGCSGATADDPRHLVPRHIAPVVLQGVRLPASRIGRPASGGDASPRCSDDREPRQTIGVTWSRGRRPVGLQGGRLPASRIGRPVPRRDARCVAPSPGCSGARADDPRHLVLPPDLAALEDRAAVARR